MKYYLMVEAFPSHPDRVDEFNEWYETTHIREVVACDGFLKATRLAPADAAGGSFITLYEIQGDPERALHNVHAAAAAKQFDMSDSLSFGPVPKMRIMQVYSEYVKPE